MAKDAVSGFPLLLCILMGGLVYLMNRKMNANTARINGLLERSEAHDAMLKDFHDALKNRIEELDASYESINLQNAALPSIFQTTKNHTATLHILIESSKLQTTTLHTFLNTAGNREDLLEGEHEVNNMQKFLLKELQGMGGRLDRLDGTLEQTEKENSIIELVRKHLASKYLTRVSSLLDEAEKDAATGKDEGGEAPEGLKKRTGRGN